MNFFKWVDRIFTVPDCSGVNLDIEQIPSSDVFLATAQQLYAGGHVSPVYLRNFVRTACMHYLNRTDLDKNANRFIRISAIAIVNAINDEEELEKLR